MCATTGGLPIVDLGDWRVVRVLDSDYKFYYRLIANSHISEFSEFSPLARHRAIDLLCAIETVLLKLVRPTKINIASLGNIVPHLHWHIVPRFTWDSHFPETIWGPAQRKQMVIPEHLRVIDDLVDDEMRASLSTLV